MYCLKKVYQVPTCARISDTVLAVQRYPRSTHENLSLLPLIKNWGAITVPTCVEKSATVLTCAEMFPTVLMKKEQLLLLVSALREENKVAHQLLESYRLLLGTTRHVMARRLPIQVQKVRLIKARDKDTIASMVSKLDKLQEEYYPHMAPTRKGNHV